MKNQVGEERKEEEVGKRGEDKTREKEGGNDSLEGQMSVLCLASDVSG